MAVIRPFKAIRPTRDKVHLVASRPVYTYTRRILNAKLETNPYTFMHIIYPEYTEKGADKTKPNTAARFEKVRDKFHEFCNKNWLQKDTKECLYIYRQFSPDGHAYTGIIGGASVLDYTTGVIKKHEKILPKRREMFSNYLGICQFNAEPVLLTYPDNPSLSALMSMYIAASPEFDFTNTDHVRHQLWLVDEPNDIYQVQRIFSGFNDIYIADGHHRSASSVFYAEQQEEAGLDYSKQDQHFMSMFISESQLDIRSFNRVVKYLNNLSSEDFLAKVAERFHIIALDKEPQEPTEIRHMLMYLDHKWYELVCKEDSYDNTDPLVVLDAQLLEENLLEPVLGINDIKTDKRIDFVSGIEGLEGIRKRINSGKFRIGFALTPVSVEQLKHISDLNLTMPPKSTWIEPKLRSGLTIFDLSTND